MKFKKKKSAWFAKGVLYDYVIMEASLLEPDNVRKWPWIVWRVTKDSKQDFKCMGFSETSEDAIGRAKLCNRMDDYDMRFGDELDTVLHKAFTKSETT